MAKGKGIKTVYLAQLDKFGYDLTAIGETREEAINAVLKNYSESYKDINGVSPGKDFPDWGEGKSYYYYAKEAVRCNECVIGKCYWL